MATMNATVTEAAEIVAAGRVKVQDDGIDLVVLVDGNRIRSTEWRTALMQAVNESPLPPSAFLVRV